MTFSGERNNICLIRMTTIFARSDLVEKECEDVKGVARVDTEASNENGCDWNKK